jgi:hypothetical protein
VTISHLDLPKESDSTPPPAREKRGGWGIGSALAWLAFPLVPTLAGTTSFRVLNFSFDGHGGPDPWDWDGIAWAILAGPLLGYGFLTGATLGLPDEPGRRGVRGWLGRRSLWVAVGPWIGFLSAAVVSYLGSLAASRWNRAFPQGLGVPSVSLPEWLSEALTSVVEWAVIAWIAGGWLLVALAALRRARRLGRLRRSIGRGLIAAVGFVGSLFGSFWAVTAAWRSYFFDTKIVPLLLAGSVLIMMPGCTGTVSYGEVRRRELFVALLSAWLLGLAIAWRWWGRPRSKPPASS